MANSDTIIGVRLKVFTDGEIKAAARDAINLEKELKKIDNMEANPEVKVEFDEKFNKQIVESFNKLQNYYNKNLSKLNLTEKFGEAFGVAIDQSNPYEDRLKSLADILEYAQKVSNLQETLRREGLDLSLISKPGQIDKLLTDYDNIGKKQEAYNEALKQGEELARKFSESNRLSEVAVLQEADKRNKRYKIYDGKNQKERAAEMGEMLGLTDKEVNNKTNKKMLDNYYKTVSLFQDLKQERTEIGKQDLTDLKNAENYLRVSTQLRDVWATINQQEQALVTKLDPNGEKGIANKLATVVNPVIPEKENTVRQYTESRKNGAIYTYARAKSLTKSNQLIKAQEKYAEDIETYFGRRIKSAERAGYGVGNVRDKTDRNIEKQTQKSQVSGVEQQSQQQQKRNIENKPTDGVSKEQHEALQKQLEQAQAETKAAQEQAAKAQEEVQRQQELANQAQIEAEKAKASQAQQQQAAAEVAKEQPKPDEEFHKSATFDEDTADLFDKLFGDSEPKEIPVDVNVEPAKEKIKDLESEMDNAKDKAKDLGPETANGTAKPGDTKPDTTPTVPKKDNDALKDQLTKAQNDLKDAQKTAKDAQAAATKAQSDAEANKQALDAANKEAEAQRQRAEQAEADAKATKEVQTKAEKPVAEEIKHENEKPADSSIIAQVEKEKAAVEAAVAAEKQAFTDLATHISTEVPKAIQTKNEAFTNEQTHVEGVINTELQYILELMNGIEKATEMLNQLHNVENATTSEEAKPADDATEKASRFAALEGELRKLGELIDQINLKKINIQIDENSNLDTLKTAFEEISSSVGNFNLENLKSLSSILKNLSKESSLAENLNKAVDALVKLKTAMSNGEMTDMSFLTNIKEIVSQGEALKNFAKVISTSSKKIKETSKQAKAATETAEEKKKRKELSKQEKIYLKKSAEMSKISRDATREVKDRGLRDELKSYVGSDNLGFGTLQSVTGTGSSAVLTFLTQVDGKAKEVTVTVQNMAAALGQIQSGNFQKWAESLGIVGKAKGTLMPDEAKGILGDYKDYFKNILSGGPVTQSQSEAFNQVNTALDGIKQRGSEATAVMQEFANAANTIRSDALEKASANMEKLEGKKGGTQQYCDILTQVKQKIDEINNSSMDPDNEKEKSDLEQINQLLQQAETGYSSGDMKEAGINKVSSLQNRLSTIEAYNSKAVNSKEFRDTFSSLKTRIGGLTGKESVTEIQSLHGELDKLKAEFQDAGQTGMSAFDTWKQRMGSLGAYLASFASFYRIIGVMKDGATAVRELDTALTEMRKVSDESLNSLKNYQDLSFDMADRIGSTALTIQNSTADWKRLNS